MKKFVITLLIFILSCAALQAQEAHPAAQATLKGPVPKATLANSFDIVFNVPLSDGVHAQELKVDKEELSKDNFEVTAYLATQVGNAAEFRLSVIPFALGPTKFPAVTWYNGTREVAKSGEITIDIQKTATGIRGDLVDIRGPYRPVDWWMWFAVFVVVFISLVIYYFYKKRKPGVYKEPEAIIKPDNRPIEVIAKERINNLLSTDLWEKEKYKDFYITLTDILRWYLSKRFDIDANVQTSAELLRNIRHSDARIVLNEVKEFLNAADMVKFAKFIPLSIDRDQDIRLLSEVIDITVPKQQEPEGGKL
ncbi:hypothetical protein AAIR98_001640 [Elusimicrobium simillimum]|uniref:hypothetical protein n=1 Tax=Elusimicrobium simillimum TaxID=3143438 RepID=UPI003C6FF533